MTVTRIESVDDEHSHFFHSPPKQKSQHHQQQLEVFLQSLGRISALGVVTLLTISFSCCLPSPAFADEYGVETEAPTLFTGESVEICIKRGPLGACQKTELRTKENDNDKASQYFKEPGVQQATTSSSGTFVVVQVQQNDNNDNDNDSPLISKLKQQSIDNKERNDRIVKMKSLENDQSASFGPFDRQVVIMNADGESFTLLQNPQAMRLKKMGYIKDRKFVTQPTKEVLAEALEAMENSLSPGAMVGEAMKSIFGEKE